MPMLRRRCGTRLGGMSIPDAETARSTLARAVALAPSSPDVRAASARYKLSIDGDFAGALKEYREGLRSAPNRSDLLTGNYTVTRSFGRRVKHDFTLGVEASRKVFRPDDLAAFDPAAASEFVAEAMPVSDTRIGPSLEYRTYSTRFMTVLDFKSC